MRRLLRMPGNSLLLAITLVALTATVGLMYVFSIVNRPLAPYSIVDLEFAGTPARLTAMRASWGAAGDEAARASLWIDFLYMPAYALLFAGLTLLAARSQSGKWQALGLWLALAPFAAWAGDALENVMLLRALASGGPAGAALITAAVAAGVKFGLLLVCLVYMVAAPAALWWARRRRAQPA